MRLSLTSSMLKLNARSPPATRLAATSGTTIFRDVGELRVKESDRLALIAGNIRAVGGSAEIHGDDLHVTGGGRPPVGRVVTEGDHRIAMAFAVLGTLPGAKVRVDNMACAAVSYPDFPTMLKAIRG